MDIRERGVIPPGDEHASQATTELTEEQGLALKDEIDGLFSWMFEKVKSRVGQVPKIEVPDSFKGLYLYEQTTGIEKITISTGSIFDGDSWEASFMQSSLGYEIVESTQVKITKHDKKRYRVRKFTLESIPDDGDIYFGSTSLKFGDEETKDHTAVRAFLTEISGKIADTGLSSI